MKKKRNKKMPTPRQKVIHNPIPTSLFKILTHFMYIGICISVCIALFSIKKQQFQEKQRCRDGVMNDFLSWCRHLLVPFRFHDLTSLHPTSFMEMIFPLV